MVQGRRRLCKSASWRQADDVLLVQVMGAPIAGSDLRAQILTGGGLRLKNLRPRIRSRRLQMLFWATGTERRGLVSLEAKKLKVRPYCQPCP